MTSQPHISSPFGNTVQGVDAANLNQPYDANTKKPPVKVRLNKKKRIQVSYGVTRDGISSVG